MSKRHIFLQYLFSFVKALSGKPGKTDRKIYRTAAVLTACSLAFSMMEFSSMGFGGSGKIALAADVRIPSGDGKKSVYGQKNEMVRSGVEENTTVLIKQIGQKITDECSDQDYQVLLKIVQAEAGGCDSKGKILVANVIMNRVKSSEFPNTITDVVYERSQFSPVQNGSIDRVQVTENTIQCVKRALAGEDYSRGALYFMNRNASRSGSISWFDRSLTYLFRHGAHEFFQ